jgi:transcriptional regulator with XRE-family HTH domain
MCRKKIGQIIRYYRLQKKMTQEQLGFLLDTGRQYVWRIENGEVNISADYLKEVITHLGCSEDDFFYNPPNN